MPLTGTNHYNHSKNIGEVHYNFCIIETVGGPIVVDSAGQTLRGLTVTSPGAGRYQVVLDDAVGTSVYFSATAQYANPNATVVNAPPTLHDITVGLTNVTNGIELNHRVVVLSDGVAAGTTTPTDLTAGERLCVQLVVRNSTA